MKGHSSEQYFYGLQKKKVILVLLRFKISRILVNNVRLNPISGQSSETHFYPSKTLGLRYKGHV